MLAEIVGSPAEQVDAVLVAGDLYESATPGADAQQLVVRTLLALRDTGAQVIAIAGNHDHAPTLDAYRPLGRGGRDHAAWAGCGAGRRRRGRLRRRRRGAGADRRAAVPVPAVRGARGRAAREPPAENSAGYDAWPRHRRGAGHRVRADAVNVVLTHLTVTGAAMGGGERQAQSIFEYHVPAAAFPAEAHYVALGHLHRRQSVPAACPVHYCGAPLRVDFGEVDDSPVVLWWRRRPDTPARVTDVPITSARPLRTLRGTLAELAATEDEPDDLLKVVRDRAGPGRPAGGGRRSCCRARWRCTSTRQRTRAAAAARRPRTQPAAHRGELFADSWPAQGIADPAAGDAVRPAARRPVSVRRRTRLMRPVRLDLDGFGSFRQPSTVDFTDADFFALVGPTGAGKSTVVDAIVFALYGSVPRWEDRRAVGWALAPVGPRAVVTLIFDVGADRYVAARELRRSGQGRVTVKHARLERLRRGSTADAAPISPPTGEVSRRGGAAARPLVRPLRPLRDPAAGRLRPVPALHREERQDTLVDLLGIRIYREVATRARAEAAAARAAGRLRRAPARRRTRMRRRGGGRRGASGSRPIAAASAGSASGCRSWSRRPRR